MVKIVQKANKQLRVADDRLEDMQRAGYFEVDGKTGKRLGGPAKEESAAALKRENAALKKENDELKAQVKEFTARLDTQGGNTET